MSKVGSWTSGGVVDFLNGRVRGITAANRTERTDYMSKTLARLEAMRDSSKIAEQETYKMLRVTGLK
jgi:hypothetical protein